MLDLQVVKALIEVVMFLEFSDDQSVAPDAAVSALESIANNLQLADSETKANIAEAMRSLAGTYSTHADFVSNLPQTLGIE